MLASRPVIAAVFCLWVGWAQALDIQPYSAAALAQAQAEDRPVAVHFHASWCPTCRAQEKSLHGLKGETGLDMAVLVADYDTETALKQALGIRSQATLVVWRGKTERARLVGQTSPEALRAALKRAF